MFLEKVFPPLPSGLMVPLAGFTTTQGTLPFDGVVIAGMIGSVLSAVAERCGPTRTATWRTIWSEAIKRVKAGVDPMSTAAQPSS